MKNENKLLLPLWIIVIFLTFLVLYIGKSIIVTLVFTGILLFIFSGIYSYMKKYLVSHNLSVVVTVGIFISFFLVTGFIISSQIDTFAEDISKVWDGFSQLSRWIPFVSNIIGDVDINQIVQKIDFAGIGTKTLTTISSIVGWLATVGFLLVFLMLEKNTFAKKIRKILPNRKEEKLFSIYTKIYSDMNIFFLSKFFLALANGVTSIIIMLVFWLEYALMFGLLVFLLDFIPTIWGIVALSLPFLYSFVQFDSSLLSFILLACLFIPQFISGNIIEPKVMGNRLNLSSFVIMISLIFWSGMWWIVWAFLAVPLMASINIVLAQFKTTQPIAIMLSKNGNI